MKQGLAYKAVRKQQRRVQTRTRAEGGPSGRAPVEGRRAQRTARLSRQSTNPPELVCVRPWAEIFPERRGGGYGSGTSTRHTGWLTLRHTAALRRHRGERRGHTFAALLAARSITSPVLAREAGALALHTRLSGNLSCIRWQREGSFQLLGF